MKRRMIEHYEILRRLGAGGRGVVYLANDTLLTRPVVLKILRRGLLTQGQMRTTVLREARLASAIEHPNVCAIYEVGETGEEAYIVMQFVPGQSLDTLIARGPASIQLVLSVGKNINPDDMGPIPSNTIVVRTAPQIQSLKRDALCITHARAY